MSFCCYSPSSHMKEKTWARGEQTVLQNADNFSDSRWLIKLVPIRWPTSQLDVLCGERDVWWKSCEFGPNIDNNKTKEENHTKGRGTLLFSYITPLAKVVWFEIGASIMWLCNGSFSIEKRLKEISCRFVSASPGECSSDILFLFFFYYCDSTLEVTRRARIRKFFTTFRGSSSYL